MVASLSPRGQVCCPSTYGAAKFWNNPTLSDASICLEVAQPSCQTAEDCTCSDCAITQADSSFEDLQLVSHPCTESDQTAGSAPTSLQGSTLSTHSASTSDPGSACGSQRGSQCGSGAQQISPCTTSASADTQHHPPVTLLVHQFVLMAASDYFQSKLLRWTTGTSGGKPLLTETCYGEEELWAAQAVLELMYTGAMPPGTSAHQAFKMLILSDRWLAPACMQLCLDALAALPPSELDAMTLLTVLEQLPSSVAQHCDTTAFRRRCASVASSLTVITNDKLPLVSRVISMLAAAGESCVSLVLQCFENVPLVLTTPDLVKAFIQLPHPAVLAWADNSALQVDSENSVAAALDMWCRGPQGRSCSQDQLKQLAQLVRVKHFSTAYLHFALTDLPFFSSTLRPLRIFTSLMVTKADIKLATQVVDMPPAWTLHPRKQLLSASQASLSWALPRDQLESALASQKRSELYSPAQYAAGTGLRLQLSVPECDYPGARRGVGLYLCVCDFTVGDVLVAKEVGPLMCSFTISCGRTSKASDARASLIDGLGWRAFFPDVRGIADLEPHLTDSSLLVKATVQFKE